MKKDLSKDFVINNAVDIANSMKKYIKSAEKPVIDLSGVEKIDLAGIQILIAAQIMGGSLKKSVYYTGELKQNIYFKLQNSGFTVVDSKIDDNFYSIRRNSSEF